MNIRYLPFILLLFWSSFNMTTAEAQDKVRADYNLILSLLPLVRRFRTTSLTTVWDGGIPKCVPIMAV